MSRTLWILTGILITLLVLGLVGVFVVSNMSADGETTAVDTMSQQKAACDVLKSSNPAVTWDTFGCHLPARQETVTVTNTVPLTVTEVVTVTLPCTSTEEVIPAPVPTEEPAPAPMPVCEWENGWSKQDDLPADGNVLGSTAKWTYLQIWRPDLGVASTVHIALRPGLELRFADSTLWAGTLYFTCDRYDARWQEMVTEVQIRDSLPAGLPALFIIEAPQAMNAAGYEVIDYLGENAVDADYSPLSSDQLTVAEGSDLPSGDAALWQYMELWNGTDANTAFHLAIAPGVVVRVPAGWTGSESKFQTRDEAKWQELLNAKNVDGLNRQLVIIDGLDDSGDIGRLPAGFTVQAFGN